MPTTKPIPLCPKCETRHWSFTACETAAEREAKKPSPELYADWAERDNFKPYGDRGKENRNYGGRLTVLPRKD